MMKLRPNANALGRAPPAPHARVIRARRQKETEGFLNRERGEECYKEFGVF